MAEGELAYLKSVLVEGESCHVSPGFWSEQEKKEKHVDTPDIEPKPLFAIGDRVWVTENVAVNGIPGVGVVRKVEKEWIDLGDELQGYWEITYQLRNLRTSFTENNVFASELEALAALAAAFKKQTIAQANEVCKRMRALGMNITTKELLDNVVSSV